MSVDIGLLRHKAQALGYEQAASLSHDPAALMRLLRWMLTKFSADLHLFLNQRGLEPRGEDDDDVFIQSAIKAIRTLQNWSVTNMTEEHQTLCGLHDLEPNGLRDPDRLGETLGMVMDLLAFGHNALVHDYAQTEKREAEEMSALAKKKAPWAMDDGEVVVLMPFRAASD